MSGRDTLRALAAAHGVADGYWDIWGSHHPTSAETDRRLLSALGVDLEDPDEAIAAVERREWAEGVPPVVVARAGKPVVVPLVVPRPEIADARRFTLVGPGIDASGEVTPQALAWEADGPGESLRYRWELPELEAPGYYDLELARAGGAAERCRVLVAPERCEPISEPAWGVSLQLYAVRSRGDWGIGDFGALAAAVRALARMGADAVGLNPLHLLFPDDPEQASPYSPSSRLFLNPLYIDVPAVPEVAASAATRELVDSTGFRAEIARLRETGMVDYTGVAAVKKAVLAQAHHDFAAAEHGERWRRFTAFCEAGGEDLRRTAIFCALRQGAHGSDPALWPDELRDPDSAAVAGFARDQAAAVDFQLFLQWIADEQLAAAAHAADEAGMSIGLYGDLALGSASGGAEVWSAPGAHAAGVGIGAPPDDFSPLGQTWGLLPMRPDRLRADRMDHAVAVLRAAMRHMGALRLDHVMGLRRLFWVPDGLPPADGAYVEYPFPELLAAVAIESHLSGCAVIGEDLGTVTDDVRSGLAAAGVLSYRVLWFEKDWHGDGSLRPPGDYPEQSLATASTHDLPTIAGFWAGRDLAHRDRLDLFPSAEVRDRLHRERAADRDRLLAVLREQGLLEFGGVDHVEVLIDAVHRFVARTGSALAMIQIEDVFAEVEQANLPGTVREHVNWRRRVAVPVEEWPAHPRIRRLAELMCERQRGAVAL